jgi:pimeloyl-ACP methyl ester carboxylesterase
MTTAPAATLVLVHGAWHGGWAWAGVQARLEAAGIASVAVDLPGHGASTEPLGDLAGDAAHVAGVVDSMDGPVVLVGHSYGGAVITEAAHLHPDGVAHLVYVTAFCLAAGESVSGSAGAWHEQGDLGAAIVHADGVFRLDPVAGAAALYGRCRPEDAAAATAQLGPQPPASLFQPVTGEPWRTVPTTYVVCEEDRAIPESHQRHMAAHCLASGGEVVSMDTDHSPFLSMPDATAALLERVARSVGIPA